MSQYVKCSLVDAKTHRFTNNIVTENGLVLPSITGLEIFLNYNDIYYGICDDIAIVNGKATPLSDQNIWLSKTQLIKELKEIFNSIKEDKITVIKAMLLEKRSKYIARLLISLFKYREALEATAAIDDITANLMAPNLFAEATLRECTTKYLANSILTEYNELMCFDIRLSAYSGKLIDRLNNLEFINSQLFVNFEVLSNMEITSNWPT